MGPKPKRYQQQRCLHFITFSCFGRMSLLDSVAAKETFERELERVRRWYGCYVTGYVVMPEHVHLLISEPERGTLSAAIQMLKQITSRKLKLAGAARFWQARYYDFPVWSEGKRVEKLKYIHRNPVKTGLVARPENWQWSSFLQWSTGCEGRVEIESPSTAVKRERMGMTLTVGRIPPWSLQHRERQEPALSEVEGMGHPRERRSAKGWDNPPAAITICSMRLPVGQSPEKD
jgi:REP-associated tyrosine transposase